MKKIEIPTKEDIINYYIVELHTKDETCAYFGVAPTTLSRWFRIYNISKTQEQENATRALRSNSSDAISKRRKTTLQKYGVENVAQSKETQDKIKKTNSERYGSENIMSLEDIKNKIKQTNLQKYGVENPFSSKEIQEKIRKTNLAKYGVQNPIQSKIVKTKIIENNMKKYGVPAFQQYFHECSQLSVELLSDKSCLEKFLKDHPNLTMSQLAELIDCSYLRIHRAITNFGLQQYVNWHTGYSHEEEEVRLYINSCVKDDSPIYNSKGIISSKKEIDIFYPKHKIAVEYNGTYWHSDAVLDDKNYHFEKSKDAEKSNIRLIHIYEHEWQNQTSQDIIKSMLSIAFGQISNKIYARKCEIRRISNIEARPFNERNHLQGHRNAQITYGLFYHNELVQLMSFSKTKYNRNLKSTKSWEIIRGCPGSNNIVVGGVSKLFQHFIKENDPDEIFSYCDFNKFDGKGYEAIGMKFIGYTGPDMKWIMRNGEVINRSPSNHKKLKEVARGKIWGAGSKKYLWTKSNN